MAPLSKVTQTVFGSSGATDQFGQFGSNAASSPLTTKDIATIQALSQYVDGWYAATSSGAEPPAIEDMNGLFLMVTTQIKYMFQVGIPEWDTDEDYYIGSIVQVLSGFGGLPTIYVSNTGTSGSPNVGNNPTSDTTDWAPFGAQPGDLYLSFNQNPSSFGVRALILGGQTITAASYPALVASTYIGDTNNPNTAYTGFFKTSNTPGTVRNTAGPYFVLPDCRGYFLRGLDLGGVNNPNGGTDYLGNSHLDAFQGHYHSLTPANALVGSGGSVGASSGGGSFSAAVTAPTADPTHGTPRTDAETRGKFVVCQIGIRY